MPQSYVKKMARRHHVDIGDAEACWQDAKRAAAANGHADDWAYITRIFKNMMGETAGYREVAGPFAIAQRALARLVIAESVGELHSVRITKIPLTKMPNGRVVGNYAISITVDQANATTRLIKDGWVVTSAYRAVGREFDNEYRKGMMFDHEILVLTRNCDQFAYAVPPSGAKFKVQKTWQPEVLDFKR